MSLAPLFSRRGAAGMASDREQPAFAASCPKHVLQQMHTQAEFAAQMHRTIGKLLQSYAQIWDGFASSITQQLTACEEIISGRVQETILKTCLAGNAASPLALDSIISVALDVTSARVLASVETAAAATATAATDFTETLMDAGIVPALEADEYTYQSGMSAVEASMTAFMERTRYAGENRTATYQAAATETRANELEEGIATSTSAEGSMSDDNAIDAAVDAEEEDDVYEVTDHLVSNADGSGDRYCAEEDRFDMPYTDFNSAIYHKKRRMSPRLENNLEDHMQAFLRHNDNLLPDGSMLVSKVADALTVAPKAIAEVIERNPHRFESWMPADRNQSRVRASVLGLRRPAMGPLCEEL